MSDASDWRFQRFRLARIYPIYVLGVLLDTPWHVLERAQAGQLAAVGQTYWASWLINLAGLQAWVPAVPFAMFWNTPARSVAAEFFFYASFPFLCGGLARRVRTTSGPARMFAAAVLAGVALYAGVIYLLNYAMPVSGETQYIVLVYNPLLRYSEFFAGCLAGQFFVQQRLGRNGLNRLTHMAGDSATSSCGCASPQSARGSGCPTTPGPSQWRWLLDVTVKYAIFVVPFTALILAEASGRTCLSLFTLATVAASVLCYRLIEVP